VSASKKPSLIPSFAGQPFSSLVRTQTAAPFFLKQLLILSKRLFIIFVSFFAVNLVSVVVNTFFQYVTNAKA
jgi:hypothetical protein